MKLHGIRTVSVEGLGQPFELGFGTGLNVVFGANGSGKSTIAQLIHDDLFSPGPAIRGEADLRWSLDQRPENIELHRLRPHGGESHPFAARCPSADHRACYLLRARDLLATEGRDDLEIARRLRREMAGGLDLPLLRRDLSSVEPRKDAAALITARNRLRDVERRQVELAAEEATLTELEREIKRAEQAGELVAVLEARGRVLDQEALRAPLLAEIAAMLPAVERLPDGAAQTRRDRQGAVTELRAKLAGRQAKLQRIEDELESDWRGRRPFTKTERDRIEALKNRLPELRRCRDEAAKGTRESTARLRGREALLALHEQDPDGDDFHDLAKLIQEAGQRRLELDALLAQRARLGASAGREEEDTEELRHGLDALERWLAPLAEDALVLRNRILLAVVLFALGLILHLALTVAWPIALTGVGVGILIAELDARARRRRLRAVAEADHANAETGQSIRFEVAAVKAARRELQRRIAAAEATRQRDEARMALEAELEIARPRAEQIEAEMRAALSHHGIDDAGPLSLVQLLHHENVRRARLDDDQLRAAEAELATVEDELDALQAEARKLAAEVGAALPESLDALEPALGRLCREHDALVDRKRDHAAIVADLRELDGELREAERRLHAFHEPLGLDPEDEGAFRDLVEQGGRRLELRTEIARIEARIEVDQPLLAARPEIQDLNALGLEGVLDRARADSERLDELRKQQIEIQTRIREALGRQEIDEALEERDRVRESLQRQREESLRVRIQVHLLERLAADEGQRVESRVLEESRRLFGRFTREAWSLEVAGDDLAARENATGRTRPLEELSDGTRVQLLMAARIAFLESIEEGEKLPLLLDEVLSTSDPERFRAIAEVLLEEASQGRQIIYFTADAHDVAELESLAEASEHGGLATVELGVARGEAGTDWRRSRAARTPSLAPPAPTSDDADAYAEQLGLVAPDWRQPAESLHLIHVLGDRLDLLHALLCRGIETLGVWRTARRSGSAELAVPDPRARQRIDVLGKAAEKLLERRSVGHGRPMSARDLADFERYTIFAPMCEILERENGDAEALIAAIENKEIPRFHTAHIDRLRELATTAGFVADRDPLSDEQIIQDSLGHVADDVEAGRIDLDELITVLRRLLDDLEA